MKYATYILALTQISLMACDTTETPDGYCERDCVMQWARSCESTCNIPRPEGCDEGLDFCPIAIDGGNRLDAATDSSTDADVVDGSMDAGRDADVDASDDAGKDGGADAEIDAGPCGGACGGAKAVCDTSINACVECNATESTACVGDKPLCDVTANACVQCLSNTDCTDPTASLCGSDGQCQPCTQATECSHLTGLGVCDASKGTGECVQCTGDTEATACNGKSCKRDTGTCTQTPLAMSNACEPCEADSECKTTMKCVMHDFNKQDVGRRCTYVKADLGGCADMSHPLVSPYSREVTRASVDGLEADYCLPPSDSLNTTSITTCEGIADAFAQKACTLNANCGRADTDDSICGESGTTTNKCTYTCKNDFDCPGTGFTSCSMMPGICK